MSSNPKPTVRMPPSRPRVLPDAAESFITSAASVEDVVAKPGAQAAAPSPPASEASVDDVRLPWEGKDNKIRSSQHQLRLTEMEQVTTRWAVDNVAGARSIHQYILQALHEKLERDLTPMLGEKPAFNLPHATPRSQSGS